MNISKLNYFFTIIVLSNISFFIGANYFPDENWNSASPESQGIASSKVKKLIDLTFLDDATQGVVIIKNGVIVGEKYADSHNMLSHGTSWSMAKSYYAALIGISIEKGEIQSLDDPVVKYLDYFNDERKNITIRDLLDMSSGLEFPDHEHEKMFFQESHLDYAKSVKYEKDPGTKFEYNNANSMILGDILYVATNKKADMLLEERILKPIGITDYKLWKDEMGNVLTYCCIDMSPRDYSKFGLLFARNGNWNGEQIIPKNFINETFQVVWETPNWWTDYKRYYSLHWWVSKYDSESKIFNTSGKFGQFTFVDRENDIVVTRVTKYTQPNYGDVQKWGPIKRLKWAGVENAIKTARRLLELGLVSEGPSVNTPKTDPEGESDIFYEKYPEVIDAIANLSRS
jgi:CubicO group peptidase (beta-lactamase class C family)